MRRMSNSVAEERGEMMVVYGETPAEGGEAEYDKFYKDVS